MTAPTISFIGVDVSNLTLDYCLDSAPRSSCQQIKNDPASIEQWVKQIPVDCRIVFEATGSYSDKLQRILERNSIDYSLVPGHQSRSFATVIGKANKTDREDAHTLMLLGKSLNLPASKVPSKKMQERKQLLSVLNALQKQSQQLSNQIHALEQHLEVVPLAAQALHSSLEIIEKQIESLEAELCTYNDEEEKRVKKLMMTVPGIGTKTSDLLIQLTDCLESFETDKQLVSFVGTAPRVHQSGSSVQQRGYISKRGNSLLRGALYMGARSARRYNPECEALYLRLREKGKPHKVAMIAVVNKMLRQVFTIVKTNTPFDKDYNQKKNEK
jgi:transposase